MKHLKTYEQYSVNFTQDVEKVDEEFFGGGKEKKAAKKFYQANADLMKQLKAAEKEGGQKLQDIQDKLWNMVKDNWAELGQGLSGEQKKLLRKDLENEIKNVDAKDSRSTIQKLGSGMASGRDDN